MPQPLRLPKEQRIKELKLGSDVIRQVAEVVGQFEAPVAVQRKHGHGRFLHQRLSPGEPHGAIGLGQWTLWREEEPGVVDEQVLRGIGGEGLGELPRQSAHLGIDVGGRLADRVEDPLFSEFGAGLVKAGCQQAAEVSACSQHLQRIGQHGASPDERKAGNCPP